MNIVMEFLYFFFTVALIENIVFTRGLGTSKAFRFAGDKRQLFIYTVLLVVLLVPSSIISYFAEKLLSDLHQSTKNVIIPVISLLIVSILYFILSILISFIKKSNIKEELRTLLPSTVYCYITLGTLFLASRQTLVLYQRIALVLGSAAGFLLATFLMSLSMPYLESDKIPRVFRGIPIKILFIGLLSLAFYGLSGHELSF